MRRLFLATGKVSDNPFDGTPEPLGELAPRNSVSKIEIWPECFGRDPDAMRKIDSHEITAIMQQLEDWKTPEYAGGCRFTGSNAYSNERIFESIKNENKGCDKGGTSFVPPGTKIFVPPLSRALSRRGSAGKPPKPTNGTNGTKY